MAQPAWLDTAHGRAVPGKASRTVSIRRPSTSSQSHLVVWPSDEAERATSWSGGYEHRFEPLTKVLGQVGHVAGAQALFPKTPPDLLRAVTWLVRK